MTYHRFLKEVLLHRLQFFPVVLLVGPRQSGKTTMMKQLSSERDLTYASFDDLNNLIGVQLDPINYLDNLKKPTILDEVQRAPEIFLPIKADVDNHRTAGRYMLTGSANPLMVPRVGDALTGRMAVCHLWPLSQGELLGKKERFLDLLFSMEPLTGIFLPLSLEELVRRITLGGYPALHLTADATYRRAWCNDYLLLSLQKDINDLAKIEGFAHLPALLHGLASRVGSTLNIEELARLAKTASTTVRRYLQLLESLFLIYRLPAWSPNRDKRLAKSPKVHFTDTALLLHVLDLDEEQLLANPHILGHLLEDFVVMECVKQATWSTTTPKMFHYRQEKEKGTEVDLVMLAKGKVVGIEIKLSATIRPEDVRGLLSLKETAGENFHRGIILYMGDKVIAMGQDITALPITALWLID